MLYTRRGFGKFALATLPAAHGLLAPHRAAAAGAARQPNSNFGGVQVGIIAPYALRGVADNVDDILNAMLELGLSAVEMQSEVIEAYAGAPAALPTTSRLPAGEGLRTWRLSQSMDKFNQLRQRYNDSGVSIDIVKFPLGPDMTDDEVDYCFQVAKALGSRAITCEPPVSETRRLGAFGAKHQIRLGFHNHTDATGVESFCRPGAWEQAFFYSEWNGANVDIGHFCAGNSMSPVDFLRRYPERITNIHLKDRKFHQGPNLPWGEGDTPIAEILRLMKQKQYKFMATIELEYPTPEGSNVMAELHKCVSFCKAVLA